MHTNLELPVIVALAVQDILDGTSYLPPECVKRLPAGLLPHLTQDLPMYAQLIGTKASSTVSETSIGADHVKVAFRDRKGTMGEFYIPFSSQPRWTMPN
jgi:hypothetical protein